MRGRRLRFRAAWSLAALIGSAAPLAAEPSGPVVMTVSTVKAKTQCFIDRLRLNGLFVPREEILARPDVEGLQLAQILVEDGASVTAGQPVAQLVRPDWLPGYPPKYLMTAPAKGLIVYSRLAVGMPASARAEPMFKIIRDGELELKIDLPLRALPRVKPGQVVKIETLDSRELAGTVRIVPPEIDPMTQQGHARVQLASSESVKPGAFATATVDAGQKCGPAAPLSAILYGPTGAVVQLVHDGRVETRPVKVGLFGDSDAEISEGIAAGDTLVLRAGGFLREGDFVRTVP